MRVTAIFEDRLLEDVRGLSGGKNTTESLTIALQEWVAQKRLRQLAQEIRQNPLRFKSEFSAENVRKLNRRVRS